MSFLDPDSIKSMGFASIGRNVKISAKASIYGADRISIGDDVRIDDFCILSAGSGGFRIGNHVHIAAYASLIGAGQLVVGDFSGISSRCSIYTSNDDYSGRHLTGPTIPSEFTNVSHLPVSIGRHAIIGAGSIVLPGATIEDGVAIGALSLVKGHCLAFGIYAGSPLTFLKQRSRDLLDLEAQLLRKRVQSTGISS